LANPDALLEIAEQAGEPCFFKGELSDRFSLVLHDLRMAGVWKRTNRGRLRRSEEMLCTHISAEPRGELTFLEIGASDGITTVEAVRALRRAFGEGVRGLLTDLNLWLLRYRTGPLVEYRATNGEPIMARLGPVGIRLARSRLEAGSGGNAVARSYLRLARLRRSMQLDAQISLVHPVARREPGITIFELDCLARDEKLLDGVAAIRASNVLNLGYFEVPQICRALDCLHAYLREGGCLVVSKANDEHTEESETGSVWVREERRFRWLEDFGSGSEIRSIVDGWLRS
jgi:hypothetical protein